LHSQDDFLQRKVEHPSIISGVIIRRMKAAEWREAEQSAIGPSRRWAEAQLEVRKENLVTSPVDTSNFGVFGRGQMSYRW
jgi:hypothetical protein